MIIYSEALHFLLQQVAAFTPLETGGVLLGIKKKNSFHLTNVMGPGDHATHTRFSFTPDNEFHTAQIAYYYEKSNGVVTYLGDWHSHPGTNAYLSDKDKSTLKNISAYAPARLADPVMVIVGTHPLEIKCWRMQSNKWRQSMATISEVQLDLQK